METITIAELEAEIAAGEKQIIYWRDLKAWAEGNLKKYPCIQCQICDIESLPLKTGGCAYCFLSDLKYKRDRVGEKKRIFPIKTD